MGDKMIITIYIHRRVNKTISLFMLLTTQVLCFRMKNELELLYHNMVHFAEEFFVYTILVNIVMVFQIWCFLMLIKVSQIVCPLNIALLTRIAK